MRVKTYFLFLFLISLSHFSLGQSYLKINEVSNRNASLAMDEDEDFNDWIELKNTHSEPINLQDYYLTDDKDVPLMWPFPNMELEPNGYMLVFASEKNRKAVINHWETALFGDSLWHYLNPVEQSDPEYIMWTENDFDDTGWPELPGGFGTGFDSIATPSEEGRPCIYLRQEFFLADTSKIMAMILHAHYDDGIVVFLNNYEILRANMLEDGIKPAFSAPAFPSRNDGIDQGEPPTSFIIDPIVWQNLLKNGRNVLAIQNHIALGQTKLLIKPWLSFAMSDSVYQNDSVAAGLPLINLPMHTNFKIDSEGEKIYLSNSSGEILQTVVVPKLPTDLSYGLHREIADSMVYFNEPTPESRNSLSPFAGFVQDTVKLTFPSGYYADSVLIKVSELNTEFKLFYTLDGSFPSTDSQQFDSAFFIDSTVVFRAFYHSDSLIHGPVSNYTFFVNDSTTLPVISLISDPVNLWHQETGIYAFGPQYWFKPPYFGANFWKDWERPVQIQQFDSLGMLRWQQDAGIKIHGNYTRQLPQKSLGFYAKSEYSGGRFDEPLFAAKPHITSVKRFLLRNAGNDNLTAHFRDLLIQTRMDTTFADIQSGYPVLAYINGDYWGIYHLREKIDRFYLEDNFGVNPDDVNLLEQNGLIISGDRNGFENLLTFVKQNNIQMDANYHHVINQIDHYNWIDHLVTNFYHFNSDWPHHNTKFWNAPGKKWRQIIVDQDVTMGSLSKNQVNQNPLTHVHSDTMSYLAIIYNRLIENQDFKRDYINRFADLMNTIYQTEAYIPILDKIIEKMAPEMERHSERWNMSYNNWLNNYTEKIRNFIENREGYMRDFLRNDYLLGQNDTITLSVSPNGKGRIKLNTIFVDKQNWNGLYFDSIPVRLEAIPNPGFEFVCWHSPTSPQLADSSRIIENWFLDTHDTIQAIFYSPTGTEDTLNLAFTEINYRLFPNAEAGNWIEIYNRENDTIDLSHWTLRLSKPFKTFEIPTGTTLPPQAFLVLAQDSSSIKNWHENIPLVVGSFNFPMDENDERLSLWDELDRLVIQMEFSSKVPWPNNLNTSFTIELQEPIGDFHQPQNWKLGCPGGTPGFAPLNCDKNMPLLFSELNYNSSDTYNTGDWVEFFNNSNDTIDLSHYYFRDGNPENRFSFPESTMIAPLEYFLIIEDTSSFTKYHPMEGRFFGPIDFGFSGSGESLSINTMFDQRTVSINYSDEGAWPTEADGTGFTIQLSDTTLNPQQGQNWEASCFLGTPWHSVDWCIPGDAIFISEIKYQSLPEEETGDWIEIYNNHWREINLKGWSFIQNGDTLTIDTPILIDAQNYQILAANSEAFYSVYDSAIQVIAVDYFNLDYVEDAIFILNPYRFPGNMLSYHHLLQWPVFQTDTNNRTLELKNYSNIYLAENWRAGCENGTPGAGPENCDTDGIFTLQDLFGLRTLPNPFSSFITIEFDLAEPQDAGVFIRNIQNNLVFSSAKNRLTSGHHTMNFDMERLSSGVYILELRTTAGSSFEKIIKF